MSKKIYDRILIDANSIGYAAHNARELNHRTGQVQAVFFSLKMIKKAIETFGTPGTTLSSALWDSKAKWRYALWPEYKGKRDNTPEKAVSRREYKRQVPLIRKAFSLIGLQQMFADGDEADDLAAAIVHNRKPGEKILLVSGDHDWLQLVNEDVDWYDPRVDGLFVDTSNFEEVTGYANTVLFSQSKALEGDGSDNIPGVAGIGEKAIPLMFKEWGGVAKLFSHADSLIAAGAIEFDKVHLPAELSFWRKKLSEFCFGDGRAVFKRNMQLMNLLSKRHRGTEILDNQVVLKSKWDEDAFIDFCHEYAFITIVTGMKQWRNTFA